MKMKKILPHICAALILIAMALPVLVQAQTRIKFLPDCVTITTDEAGKPLGTSGVTCGFNDLIQLVKNMINALIILSTLFATAAIILAGFQLLLSRGDEKARERAKQIINFVGLGYLWILGAWIIIYTILKVLLRDENYSILGRPASIP